MIDPKMATPDPAPADSPKPWQSPELISLLTAESRGKFIVNPAEVSVPTSMAPS